MKQEVKLTYKGKRVSLTIGLYEKIKKEIKVLTEFKEEVRGIVARLSVIGTVSEGIADLQEKIKDIKEAITKTEGGEQG